ncbi:MAG: 16S rRNA (guanine(527)-N(7))-methyltransferase RsmG [Thermodesulfobacteriota bacterium]|nr:16S rRNA (guanine(527)-N(7))-methyltransferase RsmG [Thermodesulfobacteriota bacterium]
METLDSGFFSTFFANGTRIDLDKDEQRNLYSWAHDFGIELSEAQVHLCGAHINELWEWNRRVNLTGLSSREKIIRELVLDSLIPSPFLPEDGRLLDVGSGAGFPGIPLKICRPRLEAHLMEANSRRVSFLKQVIRITKLRGIKVVRGRIEKDGSLLHPEGYHIITARALAPLPRTLSWCAPHLVPGGLIMNFQGSLFENALKESSDTIRKHKLLLHKSIPYTLPGKNSPRHVLIFKEEA